MAKRPRGLRSHCPVNFGLETFGDRWALLVLRDIVFRGKRSYGEFLRAEEGWATNILASRLEHLVASGILVREDHEEDGRKGRYHLTEKGLDLVPLLFEITLWSAKHDPKSEAARIPRLVDLIRKDHRALSKRVREQVLRGEAIVRDYLGESEGSMAENHVKDGDPCVVTGGTHKGKSGTVRDVNVSKGGNTTITVVQANGERFKTLARNVARGKAKA